MRSSVLETATRSPRADTLGVSNPPRIFPLVAALLLVCTFALIDWFSAGTVRLYVDENTEVRRQHGTVWQHFGIRANEVVPEIISRNEARFTFPFALAKPHLLCFTAKSEGISSYEIGLTDQHGRRLIASEGIKESVTRTLLLPAVAGELEFVVQGKIAWFDLRLVRDAFFIWPVYAAVIAVLIFAISRRRATSEWLTNSAAFAVSTIVCLAITEAALRFFSLKLPPTILTARHDLGLVSPDPRWIESARYKQRLRPNLKSNCEWEFGDIVRMGVVSPDVSGAAEHRYPFETDAEGFRNANVRAKIDIAALGDSFTDAMTSPVEEAWPAVLEKITGQAVQNYGTSAFGPQQELYALQDFAIKHQPKVVVLGFFAGNDIYDAERFEHWQRAGEAPGEEATGWPLKRTFPRYETFYLWTIAKVASQSLAKPFRHVRKSIIAARPSGKSDVPARFDRGMFEISANQHALRFAFMPAYLQKLAVPRAQLERERGWELTRSVFLQMKSTCEQNGSRLVVIFIPSKSAVYWPLVRKSLSTAQLQGALDFYCRYNRMPLQAEQIDANRLIQNELVREFCEGEQIPFLDLTLPLQTEVEAGRSVYFPDDAHWNSAGHELGARQLAAFLNRLP